MYNTLIYFWVDLGMDVCQPACLLNEIYGSNGISKLGTNISLGIENEQNRLIKIKLLTKNL